MKGIILAGGTGTRLYPLTKVTNKHLLPVFDEPMIFKPIKTLRDSGIKNIIIVLGGESIGDVVRVLGNGREFGVNLAYVYQERPSGIADALFTTRHLIQDNERVAVILGDQVFLDKFPEEFKSFVADREYDCYLFVKHVDKPSEYGIVLMDEGENLIRIEEKPQVASSNLAVTGLYLYDGSVFEKIRKMIKNNRVSKRGEYEITDLNNMYIREGNVKIIHVKDFWSDVGTKENLLHAANYLAKLK
ncbi:MAG: sugar nucleotidyltransferase [Promethearchaeota archaeon]